jgi:DNA-binding GntR family transcriptional regulator
MNTHLTKYRDMNERFMRLTRCPALLEAYRRVDAPAMITSLTAARAGKRGADRDAALDAYQHHLELLTAYEKGDCDAACAAIERHIRHTITYTKRYMDAVGGQV